MIREGALILSESVHFRQSNTGVCCVGRLGSLTPETGPEESNFDGILEKVDTGKCLPSSSTLVFKSDRHEGERVSTRKTKDLEDFKNGFIRKIPNVIGVRSR